jgi:hypothetical protein
MKQVQYDASNEMVKLANEAGKASFVESAFWDFVLLEKPKAPWAKVIKNQPTQLLCLQTQH